MLGREKAKHPLPALQQRVVVYLLDLSRASVFNVTPIMSLWASRLSRQSGEEKRQRVLNAAQIRRRERVLVQMAQHPAIVLMCDKEAQSV